MSIKKSTEEILVELGSSLEGIEKFIEQFKQTSEFFYLTAAIGQARALIASGGKNQRPFLIDIAKEYEIDLEFFSYPQFNFSKNIQVASIIYRGPTWLSFPTGSLEQKLVKFSLADWMEVLAYCDGQGNLVSRNTVLRELADKSSAHYDKDKGPTVNNLESHIILQNNEMHPAFGVETFILDICSLINYLGKKLLYCIEAKMSKKILSEYDDYLFKLEMVNSFWPHDQGQYCTTITNLDLF